MGRRRGCSLRLPLLLGALSAALAEPLHEEVQHPLGSDAAVSLGAPVSLPPLRPEPRFAMPPDSSFAAVLERPLFSPTRRPVQTAAGNASLTTSVEFTLFGVVISGGERYALVKPSNGDALERLNEGGELVGWSAVSITPDRLLLRRGTVQKEVVLDYKTPAPPGSPRKKRKLANAAAQAEQPAAAPVDGQAQPAPGRGAPTPPAAPGQ
jgi:hypothetical protein